MTSRPFRFRWRTQTFRANLLDSLCDVLHTYGLDFGLHLRHLRDEYTRKEVGDYYAAMCPISHNILLRLEAVVNRWTKRVKVRSHCVRVRISFSIRFSFRVRRTVYTESEFLSVFDLISCPQLPRQTSKCDFVSGLARFGWKRTSVSVFHGRGTDRNGTDANLMALNRRLIRKLMQSKHCF